MTILYRNLIIIFILTISSPLMAYNFSSNVVKFQTKLANKGNAVAQYQLGTMYETGAGVKKDLDEALRWYIKSAHKNINAKRRIVYIEIIKYGFQQKKHGKWIKNLKIEANKYNGEASFLLGILYNKGLGVKSNLEKSTYFLKLAARNNISGADNELAKIESLISLKKEQDNIKKQAKNRRITKRQKNDELKRIQKNEKKRVITYQKSQDLLNKKKLEKEKLKSLKISNKRKQNINKIENNYITIDTSKDTEAIRPSIKKQNNEPVLSWKQAFEKEKEKEKNNNIKKHNPTTTKQTSTPIYILNKNGPSWSEATKQKENKKKTKRKQKNSNNIIIDTTEPSWNDAVKQHEK